MQLTIKKLLVLIFVLLGFVVASVLGRSNFSTQTGPEIINRVFDYSVTNDLDESSVETAEETVNLLPSPTPVPFQEMTIPYLRNLTVETQLAELEKRGDQANYTSYLTSYTSDNLKIFGQLTIPKESANLTKPAQGWPAIIFIHGYIPPTVYKTFGNYEANVDYLARNGFVVFKIDLRGHDQSGGEAGGAYYSADYIIDVLHAYAALQDFDQVNPKAIGLWGHSMAGNVVMRTIAAKQDIPAAVIWAGAVFTYQDMQEFGIDDNSYRPPSSSTHRQQRRQALREAHGDFSPESEFWQQVVPTNYLDGLQTAIELHHAVDDDVVSIGYSRGLAEILQQEDIEHQLHEYPTGGHNISGASFNTAMQRTVEFFREQLN